MMWKSNRQTGSEVDYVVYKEASKKYTVEIQTEAINNNKLLI